MKKIAFSPLFLEFLTNIKNENDSTKITDFLLECSEGSDKDVFREDYSNYFDISKQNKGSVSYSNFDKWGKWVLDKEGLEELTDDKKNTRYDELFKGSKNGGAVRTQIKAGKILKRILSEENLSLVSAKDVEDFSRQLNSQINKPQLVLVSGRKIGKYYSEKTYACNSDSNVPRGTLASSCMRQDEKKDFFGLYEKNPNVKMLIALTADDKILGRAIIWDNVNFESHNLNGRNVILMDRIYYTYEWIKEQFKGYAIENGFYYKTNQNADGKNRVSFGKKNYSDVRITINIENISFHKYPYLDTVPYPDFSEKTLCNFRDNTESELRAHSNGIPNVVFDFISKKELSSGAGIYSKYEKTWIDRNDSIRRKDEYFHKMNCKKDRLDSYITPIDEIVKCAVTNDDFAKNDMVESKYHKGLIHKKESKDMDNHGKIHVSYIKKSEILDKGFLVDDVTEIKVGDKTDYLPNSIVELGVDTEVTTKLIEILKGFGVKSKRTINGMTETENSFTFVLPTPD